MNKAAATPMRCSDCGTAFECGMGQDTPCWCSRDFAAVMPVPASGTGCYCATCLAKHVERARQEESKPRT